jgi:hypothetical protein
LGKGRLKTFFLGWSASWRPTYLKDGKPFSFIVIGTHTNEFSFKRSEEKPSGFFLTRTEVATSKISKPFPVLGEDGIDLHEYKGFSGLPGRKTH